MDFGCGTGVAVPFLFDLLGADTIVGVDVSARSIEVAKAAHGSPQAQFLVFGEYQPCGQMHLTHCNGVFHHITPEQRPNAVDYIYRSLRPGGLFALWENNPWNPGTRYVMNRIPFDHDAVTLSPSEARRLVRAGGFMILRTDFLFIFPRALKWLRGIEPCLSQLPLGAQYQILARKP
jgi:SAM-dependent methyltransferase